MGWYYIQPPPSSENHYNTRCECSSIQVWSEYTNEWIQLCEYVCYVKITYHISERGLNVHFPKQTYPDQIPRCGFSLNTFVQYYKKFSSFCNGELKLLFLFLKYNCLNTTIFVIDIISGKRLAGNIFYDKQKLL